MLFTFKSAQYLAENSCSASTARAFADMGGLRHLD